MKASLRFLALGMLLLAPISTARAQGPSLSPIANVSVNAGGTLNVSVIAIDVDNRPINVTASLPPFATLNPPTVGTGVVVTNLTLTPSGAHVGDYSAAVTATAGGVSSVRVFQITVNAAGSNQAPIVIAPPLLEITAASALSFVVTASDSDSDAIASLGASGLPTGATFTPNGSNTSGTFEWTPGSGDAGEYDVVFTATNALSGTSVTHLRVGSPPTLMITPIDDVTVAGGATTSVPVHASGVPGELISLTAALPTFATLDPPGTGTGVVNTTVTIAPPTGSAGTYHASITAISNSTSVTELFDIIVTGAGGGDNHPPVLTAPATATVAIGSTLSFDVTATDEDGDHVDLIGSALPPGSGFIDHGNDAGTFTWTPVSGQAGTYTASFSGLDNRGGSGSASTSITVTGDAQNHAPTLRSPPYAQVNEGAHLSFTVRATDLDGDHVALEANSLPSGATFSDHGDNTGMLSWTPDTTQSGSYIVNFIGSDGNGGTGRASTILAVTNVSDTSGGGGGGGGGGEVPGRACLIGKKFKPHKESTCVRISPVEDSFDVRDVVLSSIRFRFHGESVAALDGARIDLCCHKGGRWDDGDDDDGEDEDGDVEASDARASTQADGEHHGHDRHDDDECTVSCDDDCHGRGHGYGHGRGHEGDKHGDTCDTLGVRACFSTKALLRLLAGATSTENHPSHVWKRWTCALVDAQILATLTSGDTVVATFNVIEDHKNCHRHDGDDDGDDDGDGHKGRGKGHDKNDLGRGSGHGEALSPSIRPNPLNPSTELSFTTAHEGKVRVVIYDMQGRAVRTLLDEFRSAGLQTLAWDGTNEWKLRVPCGLYFLRIQAPQGSVTQRVTVVK